jgi:hypothetical protein
MLLLPPRSPRKFSQLDGSSFRLSLRLVGHRRGRQRAPSANGVPRLRATLAILEPFDHTYRSAPKAVPPFSNRLEGGSGGKMQKAVLRHPRVTQKLQTFFQNWFAKYCP